MTASHDLPNLRTPGADQRNLGAVKGARKDTPHADFIRSIDSLWLEWGTFARVLEPVVGVTRITVPDLFPAPLLPFLSHRLRSIARCTDLRCVATARARAR